MIRHYSKNIQDIIQRELYAAQDSIKIAVAWFTNDLLFYPLLHKLMAGVKVELMLNKDDVNFSVSNIVDFDQFLQQGGVLYLNETKRLLHDKFCIIDNRIVINGSYNWTNGAKHNYETIDVFTDELESVKHYKELFESLKVEFTRQQASKTNNPKPEASTPRIEKKETGSQITYTSSDGCIVVPNEKANFDATIVSNTYEDGKGVIVFDREITVIPRFTFQDCSNLTSVMIPKGVTSIEFNAFEGCSSLANVVIPESVTSIGEGAFRHCSSLAKFEGNFASDDGRCLIVNGELKAFAPYGLTSYAIPNGVTSIGNVAFWDCSSLMSVVMPQSVSSIGGRAFFRCSSLTSVVIPNGVTSIDDIAFYGCSSLAKFEGNFASDDGRCLIVNGELKAFAPYGLTNYAIPNGVTSIVWAAFADCTNLLSLIIPNGVTKIGMNAFQGCSSLANINIPDTVTEIGGSAFKNCSSLANINIPDTVTEIGGFAFKNCSSLANITIPNSVLRIRANTFYGCSSLSSITLPEGLISIDIGAFDYCNKLRHIYCMALIPPTLLWWWTFPTNICVPRQSVEAYKEAKVWGDLASRIIGYDF